MRIRLLLTALLFACLGMPVLAGPKVVLGKLGQATTNVSIRSSASSRGRVYYRVKQYEYLVIGPETRKGWKKVLMQNGAYGYVDAEAVVTLPYEVTADAPAKKAPAPKFTRTQLASRGTASSIAQYSVNFVGTPYKWGGNDLTGGIDCSGFVKQLYGQAGVSLPRTAAEQANVGKEVSRLEDLRQGDRLYFWDAKRGKVGHTGIYYGNGYFVHSSSSKKGVSVDYLGEPKWRKILVAARR